MLEGTLNQLAHESLADQIYRLLKDNIVRHQLEPGARLLDNEIAESLQVSRTPVREAMSRLGAEGLLNIVPRRGAFVLQMSTKATKDVYEVREALEDLAVRLAVPLLTEVDLRQLEDILNRFSSATEEDDFLTCFELDRRFHDQIVRMSGNLKLAEMNALLGGSIQASRWSHCHDRNRQQASLQEHQAILHALKKRDADLASALVRDHINSVKRDLLDGQDVPATTLATLPRA
jgi:DNA-binding GntR family transcriptional regulator